MIIVWCPLGTEILVFALPVLVSYGIIYNECPAQMGGSIETNSRRN
jgi:hypothetical protein